MTFYRPGGSGKAINRQYDAVSALVISGACGMTGRKHSSETRAKMRKKGGMHVL